MLQVLVSPWTSNAGNIWELVINAESHSRSTELESAFYQICVEKKKKIELPYDPAIPLLGICRERTIIRKDACTLAHSSTPHNSQDMRATWMPTDYQQIKMWDTCNGILVSFSCWVASDSFATLWTIACQAPLSTGLPRQEYWSGFPFFFSRGSFLTQGSNLRLLH